MKSRLEDLLIAENLEKNLSILCPVVKEIKG
jgi:hypothetical protein